MLDLGEFPHSSDTLERSIPPILPELLEALPGGQRRAALALVGQGAARTYADAAAACGIGAAVLRAVSLNPGVPGGSGADLVSNVGLPRQGVWDSWGYSVGCSK
jgi:hypothetical protein